MQVGNHCISAINIHTFFNLHFLPHVRRWPPALRALVPQADHLPHLDELAAGAGGGTARARVGVALPLVANDHHHAQQKHHTGDLKRK